MTVRRHDPDIKRFVASVREAFAQEYVQLYYSMCLLFALLVLSSECSVWSKLRKERNVNVKIDLFICIFIYIHLNSRNSNT